MVHIFHYFLKKILFFFVDYAIVYGFRKKNISTTFLVITYVKSVEMQLNFHIFHYDKWSYLITNISYSSWLQSIFHRNSSNWLLIYYFNTLKLDYHFMRYSWIYRRFGIFFNIHKIYWHALSTYLTFKIIWPGFYIKCCDVTYYKENKLMISKLERNI